MILVWAFLAAFMTGVITNRTIDSFWVGFWLAWSTMWWLDYMAMAYLR